jgi:hypothetical protein
VGRLDFCHMENNTNKIIINFLEVLYVINVGKKMYLGLNVLRLLMFKSDLLDIATKLSPVFFAILSYKISQLEREYAIA